MSKEFTIDELKAFALKSAQNIKYFLEDLIAEGTQKSLKRSSLISFWINDYIDFQKQEDSFKPDSLLRYDRGSILQVDFGYRVGSELGGRHYAVVVDNNNNLRSNTITVIPLKSSKPSFMENRFHFTLKNGLYQLVKEKIGIQLTIARNEVEKYSSQLKSLTLSKEDFNKLTKEEIALLGKKLDRLDNLVKENNQLLDTLGDEIKKFHKLKAGSILEIGQLTTISKQRVVSPKDVKDVLSGLKLDKIDLDEMNTRLISLYIRS